jgi:hypothetical protein
MEKIFKPPALAILMALMLGYGKVKAQDESKEKKIKRYQWEVAANPLFFINPSATLPYVSTPSILFRRHTENIRKKTLVKGALRLRVGLYANLRQADSLGSLSINPSTAISVASGTNFLSLLQIGKEWQKQIGRFQLLYGMDIEHQFEYRKDDLLFPQIGSTNIHRVALNPFLGVKFFIDARFSLSFESTWSFFYTRGKRKQKQLSYSDFATNIFPVYAVNFSYYFN